MYRSEPLISPEKKQQLEESIDHWFPMVCLDIKKAVRRFVIFHLTYIFVITSLCILFALFFFDLLATSTLGLSLSLLFLTVSSYVILRIYFTARKNESLETIVEKFVQSCKKNLDYHDYDARSLLLLATALAKLSHRLQNYHSSIYSAHQKSPLIRLFLEKFGYFWHWEDLHKVRNLLLEKHVIEHLNLVKLDPGNLEAHAALANAYVILSNLYAVHDEFQSDDISLVAAPKQFIKNSMDRYKDLSQKAIQEFQIIQEHAPHDPWIHEQLAISYRDLGLPNKEIEQYQKLLKLKPNDPQILLRIGNLYFHSGENAKGLKIYQLLKEISPEKAKNLIDSYGVKFSPIHSLS